jgi:hypothetical protein
LKIIEKKTSVSSTLAAPNIVPRFPKSISTCSFQDLPFFTAILPFQLNPPKIACATSLFVH